MKPYCVTCRDKIRLEQIDDFVFICPNCRKSYNLYYEMLAYMDQLESTHEDESSTLETAGISASGPIVEFTDDNIPTLDEQLEMEEIEKGNKIAIPKYMKPGPGKTVIEYREVLPEQ